jgi:hypothetical protein
MLHARLAGALLLLICALSVLGCEKQIREVHLRDPAVQRTITPAPHTAPQPV